MIRFFRHPLLVISEIAALAVFGVLGAVWEELRVFQSPGFMAAAMLAAISLAVVVAGQVRRLLRAGVTARRLGSVALHAGLLAVIVAGMLRAAFAAEAVVDLVEGETLPPTGEAWAAQFPGLCGKAFQLDRAVTLEAVQFSRYPGGDLRDLSARLSIGDLAVNHELSLPGGRLFLASDFGTAALVEWMPYKREAALLASGTREGASAGPNGLRAHFRASGDRPDRVEVRVMRGSGLAYTGLVRVGETVRLTGGETLTLRGLPLWARLRGHRDSALWLAYAGFALTLIGSVLLFMPLPRAEASAIRVPYPQRSVVPGECMGAVLLLALVLASCGPSIRQEGRELVLRYNDAVSEAYRRGDVKLIDGVVGPNEGKKLAGLIGVRLDLGFTLDSRLLSLEVTGTERSKNELRVRTKEQWRSRDLKIGSGEQVGEESLDAYEMMYVFKKAGKAWLVDEIQFVTPPRIGRKQPLWLAEHGVSKTGTVASMEESKQP